MGRYGEREREQPGRKAPERMASPEVWCFSVLRSRAISSLDVGGILLDLGTSTTCSHPAPTPATSEGKYSGPTAFPCLDHGDEGETVPGNQSLAHGPYAIDPLPKRRGQAATYRCHAASPLSTCRRTPLRCGTNSRRQAGSRRRCYSTNLEKRRSHEQLSPGPLHFTG